MSRVLVIRADADTRMGTGHVMRCIALGQAWCEAGGRVVFATATTDPGIRQRLGDEGWRVVEIGKRHPAPEDIESTLALLNETGPDAKRGSDAGWLVCDGYHFDARFHRAVRQAGHGLLVVDDYNHLPLYECDLLLNQNASAHSYAYSCSDGCTPLLGPAYAFLRSEFRSRQDTFRAVPGCARELLVTLGGSDPADITSRLLKVLTSAAVAGLQVTIVTGPSNPRSAHVRRRAKDCQHVRVVTNQKDMSALMAAADMALTAAGSTTLELAFMGVPMLTVVTARNQVEVADGLARSGVAWNLGDALTLDDAILADRLCAMRENGDLRRRMSRRQSLFVDGMGGARVVAAIQRAMGGGRSQYRLRPATAHDARAVWCWANDRTVRRNSFNSRPIPWRAHMAWFPKKLQDANCSMWVLMDHGCPVGQIRLDRVSPSVAEISFSIAGEARGRGAGTAALKLVSARAASALGVQRLRGLVLEGNVPSEKAFLAAGFRRGRATRRSEMDCKVFTLNLGGK